MAERLGGAIPTCGLKAVARTLRVSVSTAYRWVRRVLRGEWANPVGRPAVEVDEGRLGEIQAVIEEAAGKVSVCQLRSRFPDVPRRILEREVRGVRKVLRSARRGRLQRIAWQQAGAVWAVDHTELEAAPALCLRDLATGKVLHADLGPDMQAEHVVEILATLFEEHGGPLMLKCDNGSAFRSEKVRALLDTWGVLQLFSPPQCPTYNGAVESSIRWLKVTALDLSLVRGGAPGEHLPGAAQLLNGQQKRGAPATPEQRWESRLPITSHQRNRMHRLVAAERLRVRAREGIAPDAQLTHASASAVDRHAIPAALSTLGVLHTQRP